MPPKRPHPPVRDGATHRAPGPPPPSQPPERAEAGPSPPAAAAPRDPTRPRALDAVVRELFTISWNEARARVTSGKVTVGGIVRVDPLFRVRDPSLVALRMNAPKPRTPVLPPGAIVHVDAHVVIVDKPAGVSTVPFDEDETGTLDERVRDWLAQEGRRARGGGRAPLGVVHRLDKDTSGLLVFTRTWLAKQSLTQQFREHTVLRRYLAIVSGDCATQTLRSEILQDRGDGLRGSTKTRGPSRGRGGEPHGQKAITHVTALEKLGAGERSATLVECRLETGRTHQIRIHLSEAGHPLVGEQVYIREYRGERLPAPRMMLHAAELGFMHPATEEDVRWEKEPPRDFAETLAKLRG